MANYLLRGTVSGFSEGVLTLQFPENASFAAETCRKREGEIRSCLQSVFGQAISLAFETGRPAETEPPQPPRAQAPVDRQERAGALDDPKVQMILKELNATPMDIQRLPAEEEKPDIPEPEE